MPQIWQKYMIAFQIWNLDNFTKQMPLYGIFKDLSNDTKYVVVWPTLSSPSLQKIIFASCQDLAKNYSRIISQILFSFAQRELPKP